MSININVGGLNYNRLSVAERAELEKRRKNRLTLVREQSKEFAKQQREKVRNEKENQLKRIQEIKRKELENLKRLQCEQIGKEYVASLENFGAAHVAALDASCEEDEIDVQKRDEYDLIASTRGRSAMLQVQRERDRAAEERLAKRKRKGLKSVSIQADLLSRKPSKEQFDCDSEEDSSSKYMSQVNCNRNSAYNPKNFTSNSVDSSNHGESINDDETSVEVEESEEEFDQIKNLLKRRCFDFDNQFENDQNDLISLSDSSSECEIPQQKIQITKKLKFPQKSPKKQFNINSKYNKLNRNDKKVNEDFTKKRQTNNVNRNSPRKKTPKKSIGKKILRNEDNEQEKSSLEKEMARRDYEKLRMELDELSKQDKEARDAANKAYKNFSKVQLEQQERIRKEKMNKAVEDAMRRNIMTCPPIQVQTKTSRKSEALNVANLMPSTSSENSVKMCLEKSSNKLTSLVKMERLKDLLDRINHQKKLLLNEIEKRDDIPGRDLDNIKDRIKTLETERAELQQEKESKSEKSKNIDLLEERENKIREREQRLEMRLKQLFKESQKQANDAQSTSTISENGETISVPPVEIIIKVPNGKTKVKKSIRCLDTLHKEPSKVYPKTPRKKLISTSSEEEKLKIVVDKRMKKVEQQTQTSPAVSVIAEPKKSILKKSPSVDSDGTSISTSYQSLPEKIHDTSNQKQSSIRKNHHKLNPVLMHYITRLLGMKTNMDRNQLNVQVSPVLTPGSSTINTSGNNDTNSDAPSFDEKRLQKLREFINENYSFLSEVNETLEENKLQDENEENISKVEGVWQEVLRKKKPVKTNVNEDLKKQVEQQINQQLSRPLIDHNKRPKTAVAGKRTPHMKENQPPVKSQVTDGDMLSMTKILESHMLNNFSEYTSNCQKRIAELAQMMEKVRREKLKLIENSLSSGDYAPFTEYKELAMHTKSQEIPTTSQSDMKDSQREDPPSEEINNILHKQTKPFGVSKDSGISLLSRPVTSSDFRDSPDVRVTSEEPENSFQPILKDIPKPPKSRSTTDNSMETADTSKDGSKKTKPPLSLNRISPLLDKPHEAHELSTIAEVETPTASRVNIQDDERIKTFINFEEYERILKEKSSLQADPKLDELMRNLEELKIKTFVGPQAYDIEEISNQSRSNSNASSLVDVLDELKKRNLYTKHVENNQSTPPSQPQSTQPDSPKRPQPTSKISSGNTETVKDDQTTPKQHHRQVTIKPHKLTSPDANDLRRFSSSSSEGNLNKMEISSSDGRPMNLADFLAKELVKRPTNRSFSDESSLSSHFMRSLLNAGSARSMSSLSSTSNDEKVRTSTPVRTKSNPSGNSMFQGDSVSTLKGSDGDRSESSNDDKQKS